MPKQIDETDIPVRRVRRTGRIELYFSDDGQLLHILAHRKVYTLRNGSSIGEPTASAVITLKPEDLPLAVKARLADIETLIDNKES